MSTLETCDKLQFLYKDFCKEDPDTNLCKEVKNKIEEINCPKCPSSTPQTYNTSIPPIGCGIGVFTVKE